MPTSSGSRGARSRHRPDGSDFPVCEHVFVRWENLSVEVEDPQRPLPKLGDGAVVRTFDAPEALGIRFHEVKAKSALNKVHPAARMPFNWTVNPYRGCTHACQFCMAGDTPILMANGRTKPLADLRVGDEIYGTVRCGKYRVYVNTEVLDQWSTLKPAYRITLEDGTELVASGDHRFWTRRGKWKYVTGAMAGPMQRPYLTLNDKLVGTGQFATQPKDSPDYRRGYLCGLIRGDAHLSRESALPRCRLALTDIEAIRRARDYLTDLEIDTHEFLFQAAVGTRRASTAIRAQSAGRVAAIRELVTWPRDPSNGWVKGFLAGIFDAEGGRSEALRICNEDPEIIGWITYCLRRLDFTYVIEPTRPSGVVVVRIPGGLRQHLRFFHTVDPAITRKRSIGAIALKSDAQLGIASIEPLRPALPLYDITTGTGDFIANGVVSHNCFARRTHVYLDLNAGRDFEREIVVKVNVPEKLRAELGRPSWKREGVALGTNTDPYQWVESRYKLMPGIWQALLDHDTPASLVSKSPLALRDLELLQALASGPGFQAFMSVPTLDERAWRETEPHTPSPRARLEAVRKMNEAGVPAGVLIAPLMPGINDTPEEVAEIVRLADDAGATSVGAVALHLRGEVKDVFFAWLEERRPELLDRYKELYANGAYAPSEERKRLQALTRISRKRRGRKPEAPSRGPQAQREPAQNAARTLPEPNQRTLF
jgi:DNA repair photolyase